jgi:hypothetical protein
MSPSWNSPRRVSPGSFGAAPNEAPHRLPSSDGGKRVSSRDALPVSPPARTAETIRGRVVTASHQAVESASVAISSGPPHPDIASLTNESGQFLLGDLGPGSYQVTVHKQGYRSQSVQVEVPGSGPITIVLTATG